jgi:hypothetical protein
MSSVHAGPLHIARYIEPFALLVAQLAYEGIGSPELAYWFVKDRCGSEFTVAAIGQVRASNLEKLSFGRAAVGDFPPFNKQVFGFRSRGQTAFDF